MASRHNATPSPAPSRRKFISQVAIAAAGLTAVAAASGASAANLADPDAHLVALLRQWQALDARDGELTDRQDETYFAACDVVPIAPEIRRGEPKPVSGRALISERQDLESVLAWWAKRGNKPRAEDVLRESQHRLTLISDYEAQFQAELVRNGHTAIEAERERILAQQREIEAEIEGVPAAGLVGIAAKLTILFEISSGAFDLEGDADPETRLLYATLREAERLAGLPPSIVGGAPPEEA